MLLSDTGLGALLTTLGLASSLFKPSPLDSLEVAVDPTAGNVYKLIDVLDVPINVQTSPLLGAPETMQQNSNSNLATSETSARASPSAQLRSSPHISAESSEMSLANTSRPSETTGVTVQDDSCAVEPYDSPTVTVQSFRLFDETSANVYRYRQQQGVNLGSWFVHEQWMTPSLFTCASGKRSSELDIASGWGSTTSARAILERHWDTFITAEDFAHLASIGINTVRIPIGYWNLGPLYCEQTPFEPVAAVYQNSWAHIVRAINMASDADLGVLIDLHGAVGSQNGQPHSGISDGQTNLFTNPSYQNKTIQVLAFLTQQLSSVTNVVGIEILNEPQNVPQLTDFYTRALAILRQISPEAAKMPFYIHDGFDLQRFHDYISARTDFVVQDHHSYFVFTPKDDAESSDDHTNDITGSIAGSLAAASQSQRNNLVIDEWSCALTADSLAKEQDPVSARKRFCEGQMEVYQKATAGWSFWSYDKDGCDGDGGWCFKQAIGKYLPSTFFSYPRSASNAAAPGSAVMSALTKMQLPELSMMLRRAANAESTDRDAFVVNIPNPAVAGISPSFGPKTRDHRFITVHARRGTLPAFFSPTPLSASQRAVTKGYTDGFLTAKIFAMYGLSKLGFVGQYVEDSLRSLGMAIVEPGNEDYYRKGFHKGLADGEGLVGSIVLTAA